MKTKPTKHAKRAPTTDGRDALWIWFGLDRASFLVLPRVLMHEMPDDWQRRMAALLDEYDGAFPSAHRPRVTATVQLRDYDTGKMLKTPTWMTDYRHPDEAEIARLRGK